MAKKAKVTNAAEESLAKQIEQFRKAHPKPTDKQKEDLKALRQKLGQLRFVRIANLRVPRAHAAVLNIGKLTGSGYFSTEKQQTEIIKVLSGAVDSVEAALKGKKAGAAFALSSADESGDAA